MTSRHGLKPGSLQARPTPLNPVPVEVMDATTGFVVLRAYSWSDGVPPIPNMVKRDHPQRLSIIRQRIDARTDRILRARARATLFAAAPDMEEVIGDLLDLIEDEIGVDDQPWQVRKAKRVLAKANALPGL